MNKDCLVGGTPKCIEANHQLALLLFPEVHTTWKGLNDGKYTDAAANGAFSKPSSESELQYFRIPLRKKPFVKAFPRGELEILSGKVDKNFGDRKSVCYKSHTTVLKENGRADNRPP